MKFYTVYKEDECACKGRKEVAHRRNLEDAINVALHTVNDAVKNEKKAGFKVETKSSPERNNWVIEMEDDYGPLDEQILIWIEEKELL